ncbi:hypothetical protein HAHE_36880 [Haloferula helveola]|uniref:Type I restriction enzyme, R subunit n=1 Tax=Haloferula helveola TaxID=490095 RepID=A0ABN6H7X8_9BACT|nr:hypothetical protein HAHE_36880 [Haloferula helveola]
MISYTEDHLIEQPAIQLMEHELGWDSVNAYDDPPSPRLRRTGWSACSGREAVEELTRDRAALSLVEANREIDKLMRGGVKVKIPDTKHGGQRTEVGHVKSKAPRDGRVVDWEIQPVESGIFPGSRRNRAKSGRSVGLGFHRAVKRAIRVKMLNCFMNIVFSRKRENSKSVKLGLRFTESWVFMST